MTAPTRLEPYAARTIRFLELWEEAGWRVKVYGIAFRDDGPPAEMVEVARELARDCLPRPAATETRYGVGFMGVHEGRGANLVFVDWWSHENELRHHVFTAPGTQPLDFQDMTGRGLAGCVWDLAVMGFERQAWISSMLVGAESSGLDTYLKSRFDSSV
jgi:hypothetical protein